MAARTKWLKSNKMCITFQMMANEHKCFIKNKVPSTIQLIVNSKQAAFNESIQFIDVVDHKGAQHASITLNRITPICSFPMVGIVRKVPSTTSTTQQQTSPQW
jgi:hypothetical protein